MPTTYTFAQKTAPASGSSNFGNLATDGAHNAMAGSLGSGPQTVDATASPLASPITVSNSSPTTLNIPLSAVQVTFLVTGNTLNISEAVSAVSSKYFTIPTGVQVTIDVARCSVLYLEANVGNATVSFFFNII